MASKLEINWISLYSLFYHVIWKISVNSEVFNELKGNQIIFKWFNFLKDMFFDQILDYYANLD
jgi:hypothetical protein